MNGWIVFLVMLIPLFFLIYKYHEKQILDQTARNELNTAVTVLQQQKATLENDLEKLRHDTEQEHKRYTDAIRDRSEELEEFFEEQRYEQEENLKREIAAKEKALENAFQLKASELAQELDRKEHIRDSQIADLTQQVENAKLLAEAQCEDYRIQINAAREKFEGIKHTLQQYDLEKQQRLYYTIQLPDEYKDDIEFLLTTVAAKVQHPDIISKLVWAEYVKPNLDDTFKRIEIKPEPGIYKITNINTGKCYIGKSTNVKTRIADHFKSSIGIRSIADQAVHHAILKEGFWNWAIEVITYCDKDKLNELEKYYIEFFKTQEVGYNRTAGG